MDEKYTEMNYIKRRVVHKYLSCFFHLIVLISLLSCTEEPLTYLVRFPLPQALQETNLPDEGSLSGKLTVANTEYPVQILETGLEVNLSDLPKGRNQAILSVEFTWQNSVWVLVKADTTVDSSNVSNTLVFKESDYESIDDDGDSFSNLAELSKGTDPVDNTSKPVVADGDFGTKNGLTIYDGGHSDKGYSIATDGDGRIFVAGRSNNQNDRDMAVWRYTPAGQLDTNFGGGDGVFVYNGGFGNDWGTEIILDNAGRILVSGSSFNETDSDIAVWRLTPDGILDTSFGGGDGVVKVDSTYYEYGDNSVVDDMGRILVAGYRYNADNSDMAVWCFTEDGVLDNSFGGGDGVATYDSGYDDFGYGIELNSAGYIFVSGEVLFGSDEDITVWRLTSDGVLDTQFGGGDGLALYDGGHFDSGYNLVLDDSERILVVGPSDNLNNGDVAVWRFTSGGILDFSFGNGDGVVKFDGGFDDTGIKIVLDSSGRIYVTGLSYNENNTDMMVWRFSADGVLDTRFNGDGKFMFDSLDFDSGYDLVIDNTNRVLVTGSIFNPDNRDMAIWRLVP